MNTVYTEGLGNRPKASYLSPAPEDLVMWAGTLYGYFFTMSCQL
jgi:hypothetical protein